MCSTTYKFTHSTHGILWYSEHTSSFGAICIDTATSDGRVQYLSLVGVFVPSYLALLILRSIERHGCKYMLEQREPLSLLKRSKARKKRFCDC